VNDVKASVIGASGYIGSELVKLLACHPKLELGALTANKHAGVKVSKLYPHLEGIVDARFTDDISAARDSDIAFVSTPYGEGMKVIPCLLTCGVKAIDLSGDYRLKDAVEYEKWYGAQHKDAENLKHSVYGLPELFGEDIKHSKLVANPGCYPTGAILALAPLMKKGIVKQDSVIIDAKSGTSGAGASPSAFTHHAVVAGDIHPYNIGKHRHTPEISQALGSLVGERPSVVFTPHLVPLVRGILCTCYAKVVDGCAHKDMIEAFQKEYAGKRFIHLNGMPTIPQVIGSNNCAIGLEVVNDTVVVILAIDNLVKGGAGQAIQSANLMLGLEEDMGLKCPALGI
jgi:N-acetyl-gamma-glutamyl-phosphate reductase